MTNPNLSHLLHADPAISPQKEQSQQPQPPHHYHPPYQHNQYSHALPPGQQPLPLPGSGQHSTTSNPAPGLAPDSTYTSAYPPPPSTTASPAATGTPLSTLATPAASPTAQHNSAVSESGSVPKGHAANSSLYQCADCLRRYSRPEHLQRHVATHTLGKRFVCDVCQKAFGRADLLKRHRANHDDDASGTKRRRINSSPGAGRVAHACQACAKARVKCEEAKPCTRCRNRNLTCEYASSEAGSAAAMHLLHLSTRGHSSSMSPQSSALIAPMDAMSHNLASEVMPPQHSRMVSMNGPPPAATSMTNPIHSQSTGSSPPILAHRPQKNNEVAQIPTPETLVDQNHSDSYQAQYGQNRGLIDASMQHFGDFLQNVLYDQQNQMDPSRAAGAHGLNVLDFCGGDGTLDMNDMDFGMVGDWNLGNIHSMLAADPSLATYFAAQRDDSVDMSNMHSRLATIWSDSPWTMWTPDGTKDNINAQKSNLPLEDINSSSLRPADKVIQETLQNKARDSIMTIVTGVCATNPVLSRVSESFPATEVLDSLMHVFLAWHLCQVSEFIHFGSFKLSSECPEFLGMLAAAGAILTPVKALRKFGYALQEALRVAIPGRFEDNNTRIQEHSLVYALVLCHDIGLWSGNRRRMEIAECHLNIPVAMLRGRGRFQSSHYPPVRVEPSDEGAVLNEKWQLWTQRESWKRLIFHLYIRDAQVSMSAMSNAHMSYAELTLPVPESRELWFAMTAEEWKVRYLERNYRPNETLTQPPSLPDLLRDINVLGNEHSRLDLQYTLSIVLHGFATLIREWRQMSNVYRWHQYSATMDANPNNLLQHRHTELVSTLDKLQASSIQHAFTAQGNVLINLLLMNLHVSLEDLELFAGKQGDDQARAIVPALQRWAEGMESRKAIWHAGQILRWAREFPTGHLQDFYAVAVHHAALALWTWGIMTRSLRRNNQLANFDQQNAEIVYLDMKDPETLPDQMMRFLGNYTMFRPAIHGWKTGGRHGASASGSRSAHGVPTTNFIEEPGTCMDAVEEIFRANFLEGHTAPIVENLCHLIKQLGNAAGLVAR